MGREIKAEIKAKSHTVEFASLQGRHTATTSSHSMINHPQRVPYRSAPSERVALDGARSLPSAASVRPSELLRQLSSAWRHLPSSR